MNSHNRTILITGATSGIGYQAAVRLINLGNNLIITCRNKSRKEKLFNKLKEDLLRYNDLKDNFLLPIVDLSDLESIETFTQQILKDEITLDSLILNAGLQYTGSNLIKWTKQNIELTFAVNHLSHFYLTNSLIRTLFKSDSPRIIITSSEVHNPSLPGGRVGFRANLGNLEGLESGCGFKMINGQSPFNADKAYKDSKLCNILFAKELARRLSFLNERFPVICWAPGLVIPRSKEGFFRHSRKNNEIGQRLFAFFARDLFKITESAERAGEILMNIEGSNEYSNESFIYLSNTLSSYSKHKLIKSSTSKESNDVSKSVRLWNLTHKLLQQISGNELFSSVLNKV